MHFGGVAEPVHCRPGTVHAAGMSRRRHDLPEGVLNVGCVVRVVLLRRKVDDVLTGVVMRHAGPVLADRDKVLAELVQQEVHVDPRPLVILHATVLGRPVLLHGRLEGLPVGERERRLLDVEERPDLTVSDRGVVSLLLRRERVVLLLSDGPAFVGLAAVLVPAVPDEGDSLFTGLHAVAVLLRLGVRRVQVRPVAATVAVERKDEGVEGRYPRVAGIQPRSRLACLVEKEPAFLAGPSEGFSQ